MTVSFKTIGCKLNKVETVFLQTAFEEAGYEIKNNEKSDIYIINTCTVTQSADSQVKQVVRRLRRENPFSLIAVVGCFVQANYNNLEEIIEYGNIFLGVNNKLKLLSYINSNSNNKIVDVKLPDNNFEFKFFDHCSNLSRPIIKLQDGCNFNCSYCVIPIVRGKSRSLHPDIVMKQIEKLISKGYKEIVLSGINIGDYGRNLDLNIDLSRLLYKLSKFSDVRFRLTSIEPMSLTEGLIETIVSLENICPHFHIPLQSGDDFVLESMGRKYTVKEYENKLLKIFSLKEGVCLGTDVIVGYPKETSKSFENTKKFINEMPFSYLHIFPYSTRRGTKAESLKEILSNAEKKKRCSIIKELGQRKSINYKKLFVGKNLKVIFDSTENHRGLLKGVSENYIKVLVKYNEKIANVSLKDDFFKQCFDVVVSEISENGSFAFGFLSQIN